jgi:hypothetical protein
LDANPFDNYARYRLSEIYFIQDGDLDMAKKLI